MAPLNLMLCVYQILPKILRALVYLAQKFLVLQDPALQAFHYCSKFFIFPSKGKVLFFYEQTYFPPLSYWSQIKSNTMSHYIKWDSEILFPLSVIYHSYIVYYYQYWEIYILYPSLSNCIEYRVNFTSTIIPVSTKLLLMVFCFEHMQFSFCNGSIPSTSCIKNGYILIFLILQIFHTPICNSYICCLAFI